MSCARVAEAVNPGSKFLGKQSLGCGLLGLAMDRGGRTQQTRAPGHSQFFIGFGLTREDRLTAPRHDQARGYFAGRGAIDATCIDKPVARCIQFMPFRHRASVPGNPAEPGIPRNDGPVPRDRQGSLAMPAAVPC